MPMPSLSDPLLDEARTTTRRIGRTFALACKLLPRDVRDDVYRLYLVFRTLDDLVDECRPGGGAGGAGGGGPGPSGGGGGGGAGRGVRSRESALLADLDARHGLPREA